MANLFTRLQGSVKAGIDAWKPSSVQFGPSEPLRPQAPLEPIRETDYMVGRNLLQTPRAAESRSVTYAQMRALADGYDVLRTVIEKRKDEMKGLEWAITVKPEYAHLDFDGQVKAATQFFKKPDGEHTFDQWLGMILEDLFVIDAVTIFRRKDRLGRLLSLDPVDGATMLVLVDDRGRIPVDPVFNQATGQWCEPAAYSQIIKGLPRTWYSRKELLYAPYNVRTNGVYGHSHVEDVIITVNIALRRAQSFLEYFRTGNVPYGIMPSPDTWTAEQIIKFQNQFDTLLSGDLGQRSKIQMVPSSGTVQQLQQLTFDALFDEWLARIVCARFGCSPAPYVRMMNRGTAETVEEAATEESLVPMMQHIKNLNDSVLADDLNAHFLEFTWTSGQLHYKLADATMNQNMVEHGAMTIDDWRKLRGQPPLPDGIGAMPMVWTGGGPVPLASVVNGTFQANAGLNSAPSAPNNVPKRPDDFELSLEEPTDERLPSEYQLSLKAQKSELEAWERFTTKRIGRQSVRQFEPHALPAETVKEVTTALTLAPTVEAVKSVFDTARTNLTRRRTPPVGDSLNKLMEEYGKVLAEAKAQAKHAAAGGAE